MWVTGNIYVYMCVCVCVRNIYDPQSKRFFMLIQLFDNRNMYEKNETVSFSCMTTQYRWAVVEEVLRSFKVEIPRSKITPLQVKVLITLNSSFHSVILLYNIVLFCFYH